MTRDSAVRSLARAPLQNFVAFTVVTLAASWLVAAGVFHAARLIRGEGASSDGLEGFLSWYGSVARESGAELKGILVGGDDSEPLYTANPRLLHVEKNADGFAAYTGGVVGGTAWLFCLPDWVCALDYLFIDEAGQVSLANAVAMAQAAHNLVLLGDQMQLEQPVQGAHPGDSGLSALQYALKDTQASGSDLPVFHPVVPDDYGLFLGETRRMHPSVCRFISESIYEGRLASHPDCERQTIAVPPGSSGSLAVQSGIVFVGVEHDGQGREQEATRSR
jgi:uncharacterized protein